MGEELRVQIKAVIRTWLHEHIHGSPVSVVTEAYNHLHGALPALEDALVDALDEGEKE